MKEERERELMRLGVLFMIAHIYICDGSCCRLQLSLESQALRSEPLRGQGHKVLNYFGSHMSLAPHVLQRTRTSTRLAMKTNDTRSEKSVCTVSTSYLCCGLDSSSKHKQVRTQFTFLGTSQ